MAKGAAFDLKTAHQYFSARCFNAAWELIEKSDRTPVDDEEMLLLSMASLWHWTKREDYGTTPRSIGLWQISRIFALLGQADDARRYGMLCLESSQQVGVAPFYVGYAYEALARAEAAAGNQPRMARYLKEAKAIAGSLTDTGEREQLLADLQSIGIARGTKNRPKAKAKA